jgi:hypothetical protein
MEEPMTGRRSPAEQSTGDKVVLRVELDSGGRLTGSAGREDDPEVKRFEGWIEFMSAVETLRGGLRQ